MMYLAYFVALCEGYLGIGPHIGLFCHLFFVKAGTERAQGPLTRCGCAIIQARMQIGLPKLTLIESVKKWQTTYFYAKNLTEVDHIGLPEFSNALPTTNNNWSVKHYGDQVVAEAMLHQLGELADTGLTSRDLILCWMVRRLLPLKCRSHKMCFTSGNRDPNRQSTRDPKLGGG